MRKHGSKFNRAFSLIELIIVVVIIGIIAAIAVPRLSRGSEGAADAALIGDLAVLRSALDLYETEHVGTLPSVAEFENQMTLFTDINGNSNATKTGAFIYGPYLRELPPLPVGSMRGNTAIKIAPPTGTLSAGWAYDPATGEIRANCATGEQDDAGTDYNTY
jgi:prepilin-type N-terminal cleavage/methylation domain-containing protein